LCNGHDYALQLSYNHAPELSHAYILQLNGRDVTMRPMDLVMQPAVQPKFGDPIKTQFISIQILLNKFEGSSIIDLL
jgi:hypothetical protein